MSSGTGVVYQIYPRSFQDSDGDGVGDLSGVRSRLGELEHLGVDAIWLSPFYPSPLADGGYDVSDYTGVDPELGSLGDFQALLRDAHARGIDVLLDLVPCHTSIEHPWFREHPDWYVWAEGDGPPNNWTSAFGGPAWTWDERSGRWYLHSFYPEQPDLDWHNPEVVKAMQEVVALWIERGADGFRLDAIDRLAKDPELRDDPPAAEPFGLPLLEHELGRDLCRSRNAPGIERALAALREAAGDATLVGEIYQPTRQYAPYLESLDCAFVFELLLAPWEEAALRRAIEGGSQLRGARGPGAAWVMSNHDFGRLSSRCGPQNERAAAVLLLTLPGAAFIYQGDEIGMRNGPGGERRLDRVGRDGFRHPMQWDGSPSGGFTGGQPWLGVVDPARRSWAAQRDAPGSLLGLYRELIELRPELQGDFELLDAGPGLIAYRRGEHAIAVNLTPEERPARFGEVVLATHGGTGRGALAPHAAAVYYIGPLGPGAGGR